MIRPQRRVHQQEVWSGQSTLAAGTRRRETMLGFDRITFDPHVMGGRACIRGKRVTVALILNLTADGVTAEEIVEAYPYLEPEDVHQALRYAAWLVEEQVLPTEPVTS